MIFNKYLPILFLVGGIHGASAASSNHSILHNLKYPLQLQNMQQFSASSDTKQGEGYTDFSGTWHGNCDLNGEEEDAQLNIQVSDTSVRIDDESFTIGDITTSSFENSSQIVSSTSVMYWNNHGKTLTEKATTMAKMKTNQHSPEILLGFAVNTFNLNQGELIIHEHITGNGVENKDSSVEINCRLFKVVNEEK